MKKLSAHLFDLMKEPRLTVLTHPDNDLLIYCRGNGTLSFEYGIPGEGQYVTPATPSQMIDGKWSRTDR